MAEYLLGIAGVEVHGTIIPAGPGKNISHIRSRLHIHEVDVVDADAVEKVFLGVTPDKVIHLAGQAFVPTSLLDPVGTFRVNIMGGVSVLEGARRQREKGGAPPAVLLVSTGEVYGRHHPGPVTEDTPLKPLNPYAVSKVSLDLIGQDYRRTFDLPVSVVRPFNHAGPRQSPTFVASDFGQQFAAIAAGKMEPVIHAGNLDAVRDYTDVRDVVRAYWAILTHPSEHAVFNVCSGQVFAVRDLIALYQEITGLTVTVATTAARARVNDIPFIAGSFARLEAATGWRPGIALRQTLADVYGYWQAELASS
jgi:GDP-4-dehydro-6-deoxy-D-mannose reductase